MHRLSIVLLVIACGGRQPSEPAQPPPPPKQSAAPTAQPILLVANKADATVSVIELPGGKVLATLPTANGPHEIAVSRDGARAVISGYGDQGEPGRSLTVLDLRALAVERTIDLGELRRPHGLAYLHDDQHVLVTAEANAAVAIVDVVAGTVVKTLPTSAQGTHMVALARDGKRAYTANIGSGTLTAIDVDSMTSDAAKPAVPRCEAIAITADGREVWTASLEQNVIAIFDVPALSPDGQIPAAGVPIRITPTPDGKTMLVSNVEGSTLQVIDVATRKVDSIAIPATNGTTAAPIGAVVSHDSATAYVALAAENRVAVVDLATRTIIGYLTTGRGPDGIAYSRVVRS
jgi:DNA-binding beta-propeller fold protein YncE